MQPLRREVHLRHVAGWAARSEPTRERRGGGRAAGGSVACASIEIELRRQSISARQRMYSTSLSMVGTEKTRESKCASDLSTRAASDACGWRWIVQRR